MERQTQIDFGRAEQLAILRNAALPELRAGDGVGVSAAVLKGILRAIDDHGRGREAWLAFDTIAGEVNCSVRTAKRAIECLTAASLLCVERRRSLAGVVCNHYRIVWSELALLDPTWRATPARPPAETICAPEEPVSIAISVTDQSAVTTDQSAVTTDQSAVTTDQSAASGTQRVLKRIEAQIPPPPPTPSIRLSDPSCPWSAAAAEWASRVGNAKAILEDARQSGLTLAGTLTELDRLWSVANDPLNRTKLRSPGGAIVRRWFNGSWPADGILEGEALAEATAKRQAAADAKHRQAENDHVLALIRTARTKGWPDRNIDSELRRRGLGAVVDRLNELEFDR